MKINSDSVTEGIERAFGFWLSDHPVSMGGILEDAIAASFTKWLDEHSEEITKAIAKEYVTSRR